MTPEEAAKINLTSKILLKSGDQAVIVGYFHNLHCIVGYELTNPPLKLMLTILLSSATSIKASTQRPTIEVRTQPIQGLGIHVSVYSLRYAFKSSSISRLMAQDHCLEILRRSVLCQPDLTLQSIHWQDERKRGMDLEPESTRECVDFTTVYDFTVSRRFSRVMIVGSENSVDAVED